MSKRIADRLVTWGIIMRSNSSTTSEVPSEALHRRRRSPRSAALSSLPALPARTPAPARALRCQRILDPLRYLRPLLGREDLLDRIERRREVGGRASELRPKLLEDLPRIRRSRCLDLRRDGCRNGIVAHLQR